MLTSTRLAALAVFALSAAAVQTKIWSLRGWDDFEKSERKNVALRSDGRLTLAPVVAELFDAATPHLWAMAQHRGELYAAGGGQGGSNVRIFRVRPGGQSGVFAEIEGLEIHALAVDAGGTLFAATSPEGKVWRVGADGKSTLFYASKTTYIWGLAFDRDGSLIVAGGDPGEIHRVAPDGKGQVVVRLEDTHARSMALSPSGDIVVGTEPSGLVVRVNRAGQSFILHQTGKREITSVAVSPAGRILAAAVGSKTQAPVLPTAPSLPAPAPTAPAPAGAAARTAPVAAPMPLPTFSGPSVTGGSELVEIDAEGVARTLWSHAQEVIYSVALAPGGEALLATGNRGAIYRVDSPALWTHLATVASAQVTVLLAEPGGAVMAATSNVGKVVKLGAELESSGFAESNVFDAGTFTYWGRVNPDVSPNGGSVEFETRSGNVDRPHKSWSAWEPLKDGRVASPPARFLQWRASLKRMAKDSPEVFGADVAWMAKNLPPRVDEVEATPANYRFPAPAAQPVAPPKTMSLPPMGKRSRSGVALDTTPPSPTLTYAKGMAGARWLASDPNGDTLEFRVEIKGAGETSWKLLRDRVRERYVTFDTTAFPDGEYSIRVVASDAPDNPSAGALTGEMTGSTFLIDNTAPRIEELSAQPAGGRVQVRFRAVDDSSWIARAEYSVNGVDWLVVEPVSKLSDSKGLAYELLLDRPQPGELTIAVRVMDEYDNQAAAKVVVR
jgi:hypothetical protein